jgi:hypothetical protein
MQIALTLSDELGASLGENADAVSRIALEALAVEGYRSGKLSAFQVRQMLGHESRWETEDFLSAHGVWPGTSVEELEAGLHSMARFLEKTAPTGR